VGPEMALCRYNQEDQDWNLFALTLTLRGCLFYSFYMGFWVIGYVGDRERGLKSIHKELFKIFSNLILEIYFY
jgi:hypothetical protein